MVLSPWHKKTAADFNPQDTVWTAFYDQAEWDFNGEMFSSAFSSESELKKECFWFDGKKRFDKVWAESMTAQEYVKRHWENLKGMNPFWDIGRLEFMQEWAKKQITAL